MRTNLPTTFSSMVQNPGVAEHTFQTEVIAFADAKWGSPASRAQESFAIPETEHKVGRGRADFVDVVLKFESREALADALTEWKQLPRHMQTTFFTDSEKTRHFVGFLSYQFCKVMFPASIVGSWAFFGAAAYLYTHTTPIHFPEFGGSDLSRVMLYVAQYFFGSPLVFLFSGYTIDFFNALRSGKQCRRVHEINEFLESSKTNSQV